MEAKRRNHISECQWTLKELDDRAIRLKASYIELMQFRAEHEGAYDEQAKAAVEAGDDDAARELLEKRKRAQTDLDEQAFLQPGTEQVAAGYAIYGPQTMLILTLGDGVMGFTLDREMGSFVLTHENMKVPTSTAEFAINMSNQRHWEEPVKRYVSELLAGEEGPLEKNYNMRWIASMVADVHRILTRGGLFMYPSDAREPEKPGKLRLMYEANPMSMLIEQAGGAATNGSQRILDIQPESLHQRVAVFLGSKEEVERVTGYHQG